MGIKLSGKIEREGDWFVAQCTEIPGIITQGRSLDELLGLILDAISSYFAACRQMGQSTFERELQKVAKGTPSSQGPFDVAGEFALPHGAGSRRAALTFKDQLEL